MEILGAASRAAAAGCEVREVPLPAQFVTAGLVAVQFHRLAPGGRASSSLTPGRFRLLTVVDGMLAYSDSLGAADQVLGGEVHLLEPAVPAEQVFENPSDTEVVEIVSLQAETETPAESRCLQRYFSDDARRGHLCSIAVCGDSREAMRLSTRMGVALSTLTGGNAVVVPTPASDLTLVCVMVGSVTADGQELQAAQAVWASGDEPDVRLEGDSDAELLTIVMQGAGPSQGATTRE